MGSTPRKSEIITFPSTLVYFSTISLNFSACSQYTSIRSFTSERLRISSVDIVRHVKTDIIIEWNELNPQEIEYGARISKGRYIYRIMGIMDGEEFKNIIENIYFPN